MENENNSEVDEQMEDSSKHLSYEQQQLETMYNSFREDMEAFFSQCKNQIRELERARREDESTIRAQTEKIEKLGQKKTAWKLLDGLGYAFARLYKTIEALPEELCARQELIACIEHLNSELENFGIHPIYELSHGEYHDRTYYKPFVRQARDESQVGAVEVNKVGFEIDGEGIIEAQYWEYVKDKNFGQDDDLPEQETQLPFRHNIDFRYIQEDDRNYIQIISDYMLTAFDDMIDRREEGCIQLNRPYYWSHLRRMHFQMPQSQDKRREFNVFYLTMENDELYLYLCEAKPHFGKLEYKSQEKLLLATI